MKKIAVFGKPAGGKSRFSRQLSRKTGIPYYPLDLIEYQADGQRISPESYSDQHLELITRDSWIIDGLGSLPSFWSRIDVADTLIYIDLPYSIHYWWVVKRLLKSVVVKPEGWPEGSSVLKGSIASWKYLRLSPKFWTSELLEKIHKRAQSKNVYHIRSVKEMQQLLKQLDS